MQKGRNTAVSQLGDPQNHQYTTALVLVRHSHHPDSTEHAPISRPSSLSLLPLLRPPTQLLPNTATADVPTVCTVTCHLYSSFSRYDKRFSGVP